MTHGMGGYKAGCKCPTCREANASRVRRNRARRLSQESRLSHGTRSAYDAGCRCEDCRDSRLLAYMKLEGGYREHRWRRYVTGLYWEARIARDALRESGATTDRARGGAGSDVAMYQLEGDDFDELYPPVLFRQVLESSAGVQSTLYVTE